MDQDEYYLGLIETLAAYRHNLDKFQPCDDFTFVDYVMRNWHNSHAQGFQDLFVAIWHQHARGKFFVEFGATDGVAINNTFMLERSLGWNGILAEPAKFWHEALRKNRHCVVDQRCVWTTTGETLLFNQTPNPDHSTISSFSGHDYLAAEREGGEVYEVKTVSLLDLLIQHGAPKVIDYLSVDTEGSELEILEAFDFRRFDVRVITVEHNDTPDRQAIFDLLSAEGYTRILPLFSRWDDWYVFRG